MRKIISIILCVLLAGILAVPALADQSATMSISISSDTVSPGDTITVTVSTSPVENCTSGGFLFSFDKNVFEYVSGKSLSSLDGFTAGISTAAGNLAGYFMNGRETVQGNIFQIILTVKDDVTEGTYKISGTPSLMAEDGAVSCSAGSVDLTIGCTHSYGNWTEVENDQHSKVCSECQNVRTENHDWNSGSITKQPSCNEEGIKTYICTYCDATKTESLPIADAHNYTNSYTDNGNGTHTAYCVCMSSQIEQHKFDVDSTAITDPEATEDGRQAMYCVCGAKNTTPSPKMDSQQSQTDELGTTILFILIGMVSVLIVGLVIIVIYRKRIK